MKNILFLLCFIFSFQFNNYAQLTSLPRVDIPGSEVRKIHSSIEKEEYELQISLPAGYEKGDKKYPVVYLMDSQWDFPLLKALYGQQYFDGFIPEMIIVGVTWGGVNPNPDSLRARDYTPTNEKRLPQSGGAAKFLSFLQKEVIPLIETTYRADKDDRILMGCSLGGLFTLYTLFTEPGLFHRYIAASPAFAWDKEVIYQYEQKYSENTSPAPAKLFMCVGGVERGVSGFKKLANHLSERNYTSLQIKTRVLENTGHSGTKGEGYARGLQSVFERPLIQLSTIAINKYTGSYQTNDGTKMEIKSENNQLAIYFGGTDKYLVYAADKNNLYATAAFLNIHFNKDEKENITGFEIERYGRTDAAKKIN
jgi:predicted alpha/beta superfamily hydrolase